MVTKILSVKGALKMHDEMYLVGPPPLVVPPTEYFEVKAAVRGSKLSKKIKSQKCPYLLTKNRTGGKQNMGGLMNGNCCFI